MQNWFKCKQPCNYYSINQVMLLLNHDLARDVLASSECRDMSGFIFMQGTLFEPLLWVIMGQRGYAQNASVLIDLTKVWYGVRVTANSHVLKNLRDVWLETTLLKTRLYLLGA